MALCRRPLQSLIVALLVGGALTTGCDTAPGPAEIQHQVVVESYLIADEPLPPVRLSRTTPVADRYNFNELAVRGADVTIDLLDESGGVAVRYPYIEDPDSSGVYLPGPPVDVLPLRTYRLRVRVPGDEQPITATTVVPGTFRLVSVENNPVVYQGPRQVAFTVTQSQYPGRDQAFYLFTTEALNPSEDQLTPLVAEFVENGEVTVESVRLTSSPVLNEASYEENPDGTLTVRLPWIAVAFYGANRATTNAIDDNLYDFVRSQNAQQGGGAFSPGAIPNVIEHVNGGTGVFGSLARQSATVQVLRPSEVSSARR